MLKFLTKLSIQYAYMKVLQQQRMKDKLQQSFYDIFQVAQNSEQRPQQSEFYSEYMKYFEGVSHLSPKEEFVLQISKKINIQYDELFYSTPFSIKLISHNSSYEILQCRVHIAYFTMIICIYYQRGTSKTHVFDDISTTNFGIYATKFNHNKITIKCLPISQYDFQATFRKAVQQYCILKIASNLRIGPSIDKIFGFDFILYDDCLEFGMQYCEPILDWSDLHTKTLKKKLYMLHQVHIVHQDIKPENILFSPAYKEYVFIDYGLSRVIVFDIGNKTQSQFVGTLGYCSPEMMRCYYERSSLVDLYYNDVYCLKVTINQIEKMIYQRKGSTDSLQQINRFICHQSQDYDRKRQQAMQQLFIIYLKSNFYFLRRQNYQYIDFIKRHREEFMTFLKTIPFSWVVQRYRLFVLDNQISKRDYQRIQENKMKYYRFQTRQFKYSSDNQLEANYKVTQLAKGIWVKENKSETQQYIKQDNVKAIVLNIYIIDNISKYQYYDFFIKFVDLCSIRSTFQEKISASKIMISVQDIRKKQQSRSNIQSQVQVCLNYLLKICLEQKSSFYLNKIPTILANLIIYQTFSAQQLIKIYQTISKLQIDPLNHIKILFKCFVIRDWIIYRAISRYKFTNAISITQDIILTKIHQINSNHHHVYRILDSIQNLICHDIIHKKSGQFLTRQVQKFKDEIDERFLIQLLLYERLKQLQQIKYACEAYNINESLEDIYVYIRKLYYEEVEIDYFTLRLLVLSCQMNISNITLSNYQRLSRHLANYNLISQFQFYYSIQYNSYCNYQISSKQVIQNMIQHSEQQCFLYDSEIMSKLAILIAKFKLSQRKNLQAVCLFESIIKIQALKQIKPPTLHQCNIFQYNYMLYYKIHFLLVQCLQSFALGNKIQQFCNTVSKLRNQLNQVACIHCRAECQQYIRLIDGVILIQRQRYFEALQVYFDSLDRIIGRLKYYQILNMHEEQVETFQKFTKKQLSHIQYAQIQQIIYQILKISCILIDQNREVQLDDYWNILIKSLKLHQLYWVVLIPHFSRETYQYFCIYSFIITRNVYQFYYFHLRILEFMSFFHSSALLNFQNYLTVQLSYYYPQKMTQFNQTVKERILTLVSDAHYECLNISLFFSACLRFQKRRQNFNKVIRFICSEIQFVHHNARTMVLGNMFYYKLRTHLSSEHSNRSSKEIQRHFRIKASLFKTYIKNDVFNLSFKEFIMGLLVKPFQRKPSKHEQILKQKIMIYYQNIIKSNIDIIAKLEDLYICKSPFQL